ncbi:MAG: hypothetical protein NC203_09850 [Firmicutes bacterium]|nr:hypothetical protein [[Eubacterium] siraeum]MCM1488654.1 hypothetical protein [Bacillota bacterium]
MKQHIRIHKAEPNINSLDFSYLLDAPAGKHGFVSAKKGHFYFEDGTRARFLGFNVAARSNMPDHLTAEKMAARFASMGVNVIRLHAADAAIGEKPCTWSAPKEAPLLDYEKGNTRSFNKEGLDRFDYFFAKLKEKGIYLHIDLLVARSFLPDDGLDYPAGFPATAKCYPVINEALTQRQQEYAKELLTHKNPYTGLSLAEDPAVITVQLTNEESAIKATDDTDWNPELQPYRDERQKRFNDYLLMKYHNRSRLAEAWTFEGVCALKDDEDPEKGTVKTVPGGFVQPPNEPMGQWDADNSPPRYADYMEFGILMNRKFYQRMKDYVRSLGVKAPIVCSNLLGGAADVYGHSDGDLMENNSYVNHPMPPFREDNIYMAAGPVEYVSTDPLTMQRGIGSLATTILSLGSLAVVNGKPFMLSEWNEYGLHPFHSTAVVQTVAYACLNDWDGLILYNHHTSENWDDQPADEILNVFDCYNDPAVICQWGFMAEVFLKGLVAPSNVRADIVYTQNDLRTLPNFHSMPSAFLPYIMKMRNVFLDGGDSYQGDADVAFNAGHLNIGNLSEAKHGVYYAWSPYRDAWRRSLEPIRLSEAAKGTREMESGVHLGEQALVFDNIAAATGMGDYRHFAELADKAFKEWGLLPEGSGYVEGKLISDTKEITFDPDNSRFTVATPYCAYFSGAPVEIINLSDKINVSAKNGRISVSLLPKDKKELSEAKEFILTAMGNTGMDETEMKQGQELFPGYSVTEIRFAGKLYADTLEGSIAVTANSASLTALDPTGAVIGEIKGNTLNGKVIFELDGAISAVQYKLEILD